MLNLLAINKNSTPFTLSGKSTNDGKAPLDGSVVTQARQDYDQNGQIVVSMQMNSIDFARDTRKI